MTEKEKMSKGLFHNPNLDQQLTIERSKCKVLCGKYNKIKQSKFKKRDKVIKQILGSTKQNLLIEQPFMCDYGYNISVGENFYMNHGGIILDSAKVTFGDNVFIGPNVSISTPNHSLDMLKRAEGIEIAKEVIIGNNVWFGANVTVIPGVVIGDNVVIGAGSVVVKNIPSNSIAVGNPCKVISKNKQ